MWKQYPHVSNACCSSFHADYNRTVQIQFSEQEHNVFFIRQILVILLYNNTINSNNQQIKLVHSDLLFSIK